jgi:hypothetical protein
VRPNNPLIGGANLPFTFQANYFYPNTHRPLITNVGQLSVSVAPEFLGAPLSLSGQLAVLRFSVSTSGATVGGEQVRVARDRVSNRVEDKMYWSATRLTASALAGSATECKEGDYHMVCDLSPVPFLGTQAVDIWVYFVPRTDVVGPLNAVFTFEAEYFVPQAVQPDIVVTAFLDPDRAASQLTLDPRMANVLVSGSVASPVLPQLAGDIVRLKFVLRSTGTSGSQERLSIPAEAVTGSVRWFTSNTEIPAKLCPLSSSRQYVCDLSTDVTFFRNTVAEFWVFFVPNTNATGVWNYSQA